MNTIPSIPPLPPDPTRILLVDDHQIVRDGLRMTLGSDPALRVVGEANDGRTALAQVEALTPDVVVMDIGLPDADGVDLSKTILQRRPEIRVIILSAVADQEHLDQAMEAGVSGYVLKVNAVEDLVRAIRAVRRNETYLSPEVSSVLVAGYKRLRDARRTETEAALTDRECQVLRLIAEGRNTKEIAGELSLSVKTVETHRGHVMDKLNLHSIAELTKYAIRMGYTAVT